MFEKSAFDIYTEETSQKPVISLCRALDHALGGGLQIGIITELCGPPGSGKTQMCKQLAINVQLPAELNGIGGKAIYVDTNQSFDPKRLQQIANHTCSLYEKVFNQTSIRSKCVFDSNNILENISYTYCRNFFQLLAAVELIKEKVASDPHVKLIVIDSLSFPFRRFHSYTVRTRILYKLLTDLQVLADTHHLAVIITNELTTRFAKLKKSFICPALGDSFGHKIGQRIVLGRSLNGNQRVAFLQKCFSSRRKYINFKFHDVLSVRIISQMSSKFFEEYYMWNLVVEATLVLISICQMQRQVGNSRGENRSDITETGIRGLER